MRGTIFSVLSIIETSSETLIEVFLVEGLSERQREFLIAGDILASIEIVLDIDIVLEPSLVGIMPDIVLLGATEETLTVSI